MVMNEQVVGVIGGTGLYEMDGLTDIEELRVDTPYGETSDAIVSGRLGDVRMLFLPRHGRGHRFIPSVVPYRANIWALKKLGADWIVSVSAVGSLKEEIRPGDVVIVDQFIDRTRSRENTFFDEGIVAHVVFADPVCPTLASGLLAAARKVGGTVHPKGTYTVMEGPAFSTRAESHLYRSWGSDLIGMTNLPEAKLAREAEICYATIALATDYDCWRTEDSDVELAQIIAVLKANVAKAKKIVAEAVKALPSRDACKCATALKDAIVTSRELIPEETRTKLGPIAGRYL
jgi:5'-methylthioadenosine phosphorylase